MSRGPGAAARSCGACLGLLLACSAGARADAKPSPYAIEWTRDLSVTGIAAVAWIGPELMRNPLLERSCPCYARDLNPLDRPLAGEERATPALVSDIGIVGVYALSFALAALDVASDGADAASWLADAVVIAQTLALNGALNVAAKLAFARPRPLVYGRPADDPALADGENYASFYSEHSSGAFAAGLASAQTFALRHPDSPYRFVAYAAALVAGSAIATLRVVSGRHFPSDVLVGAIVGSAIGMSVPWLHARHPALQLSVVATPALVAIALSASVQ